ncbi:hypothetical protein PFY12_00145 [Chryseobacterium camelliae]|uniref:Uncharacterized protein n=1 Tax=Chryseobacterium camelliae TaxID=1265445 RepID=A0ABY7QLL5_9FLAO|nr:hypothetical protein [Chryseobacterium camelliae]WBV60544.1 hypothetical protein PFY12_00145 [Chryseobacterium camelliae]
MKSLQEFIAESLENSAITTVQENTEKQIDEKQVDDIKTNENNENIL